jgi:hypothetical protein
MTDTVTQAVTEYLPRVFVFYSRTCPGCIKKLGLLQDGVTQKTQTNLTKALDFMARSGFEVIRLDIDEDVNKSMLLSITARADAFLPVLISPFAIMENPPILSLSDLVDALLGLKSLVVETGHKRVE